MRILVLRLLTVPSALALLAGCGAGVSNSIANSSSPLVVAGNWEFHIQDPGPGGVPPLGIFTGALTQQGTALSGTFRATGATTCVAPTFDVQFTGTEDAQGDITLNSTNVPNNVITLTGSPVNNSLPGSGSTGGSLTIGGNGACAFTGGVTALLGYNYKPLSGAYSASLSSVSGVTGTAMLTQSAANSDGMFPETGSFTIGTGFCATTFLVNGFVAGPGLSATLTSTSGPVATAVLTGSITDQTATAASVSLAVSSGICNSGTYSGTLTAQ